MEIGVVGASGVSRRSPSEADVIGVGKGAQGRAENPRSDLEGGVVIAGGVAVLGRPFRAAVRFDWNDHRVRSDAHVLPGHDRSDAGAVSHGPRLLKGIDVVRARKTVAWVVGRVKVAVAAGVVAGHDACGIVAKLVMLAQDAAVENVDINGAGAGVLAIAVAVRRNGVVLVERVE